MDHMGSNTKLQMFNPHYKLETFWVQTINSQVALQWNYICVCEDCNMTDKTYNYYYKLLVVSVVVRLCMYYSPVIPIEHVLLYYICN